MYFPREAERDFNYVKWLHGTAIFVFGVFWIMLSYDSGIKYFLLRLESKSANAMVLSCREFEYNAFIIYVFQDSYGNQQTGQTYIDKLKCSSKSIDKSIPILYFSIYPSISSSELDFLKSKSASYVFIFGVTSALIGIFIFIKAIFDIYKHKQEDKLY